VLYRKSIHGVDIIDLFLYWWAAVHWDLTIRIEPLLYINKSSTFSQVKAIVGVRRFQGRERGQGNCSCRPPPAAPPARAQPR
jgi:hypothetical protein